MKWFKIKVKSIMHENFFEVCAHDVIEALQMMKEAFGISYKQIEGVSEINLSEVK